MYILDIIAIIVWLSLQIIGGIWLYSSRPSREIASQYDKKLFKKLLIPFSKQWENSIAPNHRNIFARYRRRLQVEFYILLFLPFILFFIYKIVGAANKAINLGII